MRLCELNTLVVPLDVIACDHRRFRARSYPFGMIALLRGFQFAIGLNELSIVFIQLVSGQFSGICQLGAFASDSVDLIRPDICPGYICEENMMTINRDPAFGEFRAAARTGY